MVNTSLVGMVRLMQPLRLYSLRENSLVYWELLSYAKGFGLLYGRLGELYREAFLQTAEGFGITEREKLMNFPANSKLPLETRRELLRYTLSMAPRDYNLEGIENGLHSIGLDAKIQENREEEKLSITSEGFLGNFISYDRLKRDALRILPAHLEVDFEFGSFTWEKFEAKDWDFDRLDKRDFTWDEFEVVGEAL